MRRHILFFISAVGILLSCQRENPDSLPGKGSIEIGLVSSKLTRGAADGDKMNNLHIWLVNGSGVVSDYLNNTIPYIDDKTGYCTIAADGKTASALFTQVDKGKYTLYFVANLPSDLPLDSYSKGKSIDSNFKDKLLASVVNNKPPYDESVGMPLTLVEDVSVGAGTNKLSAELLRTCARIRLTVRNNTVENSLVLKKVALSAKGNPSTGYLFPRFNYSIPSSAVLGPFDSLALNAVGDTTNIVIGHGKTHTYIDQYMYETGPNGSVSLGFTLEGGIFQDGIRYGEMGNIITSWYEAGGTATKIATDAMYFIKNASADYYIYDNGGSLASSNISDLQSLLDGPDWQKYAWKFSSTTNTTTIRNVSTGKYLTLSTSTAATGSKGTSLTMSTSGSNFKFYIWSWSTFYYHYMDIGETTVSVSSVGNTNKIASVNLVPITLKSTTELKLKDNLGNAAEKYFDKTVTSLHYIGKYGTPVPLEHIYRNQDVQIVVNVHYNPSSGVLYFETTDWEDVENETTFD